MSAATYNRARFYGDAAWASVRAVLGLGGHGAIVEPGELEAVERWQATHGLIADGMVGPQTLAAIQSAASNGDGADLSPLHPMPEGRHVRKGDGYEHALRYPYEDKQWAALLDAPTWTAAMLGLVSSRKSGGRFNRSPWSVTALDTISLGLAHWWAWSAPTLLAELAETLPELASLAFGAERAAKMRDPDWTRWALVEAIAEADRGEKRGKLAERALYGRDVSDGREAVRRRRGKWAPGVEWLAAGWWLIGGHPDVIRLQADTWLSEYVRRALRTARKLGVLDALDGPDGGRIMAGLARAANSGKAPRSLDKRDPLAGLERWYRRDRAEGGYGKPHRWDAIEREVRFAGAYKGASIDHLDWTAPPVRPDGVWSPWELA